MKVARVAIALLGAALAPAATTIAAERPLDPGESQIAVRLSEMGVPVTGVFKRVESKVTLDPARLAAASATIEVDVASLSTGDGEADDVARTEPWLDTAHFPSATFKSTAVKALGGGQYEIAGALTLKGKTRDVTAPFTLADQPDGSRVAAGELVLHRTDFGVGGGEWNRGDLVANDVTVRFRIALGAPRRGHKPPMETP